MIETDLGAENREVVKMAALGEGRPFRVDAVGAVALPEEVARCRVDPLTDSFEVFSLHGAAQSQQFRAATVPMPYHALVFGVVVALCQITGCVSFSVRHGADREHGMSYRVVLGLGAGAVS